MRKGLNHGGRREGAGRPAGAVAAVCYNSTHDVRIARHHASAKIAEIVGTSRDPLNVVLDIATDPRIDIPTRLEAAIAGCQFVHPKLSAVAVATQNLAPGSGDDGAERLRRELDQLHERRRGTLIEARAEPADPALNGLTTPLISHNAETASEDR
jgi:hypothetical protein